MLVTIGLRGSLNTAIAQQVSSADMLAHLRMFQLLLEMAETNGVFVSGGSGTTVSALAKGLDMVGSGHPLQRSLANNVARAIEKASTRFIPASAQPAEGPAGCGCPRVECSVVIDVTPQPEAEATPRKCNDCGASIVPMQRLLSAKETKALRKTPQVFVDTSWTKEKFETEVWTPLFRFTTKAEVYDRQLYRIIDGIPRPRNAGGDDEEHQQHIADEGHQQYIAGVQWICKAFAQSALRPALATGNQSSRVLVFNGEFRRSLLKAVMIRLKLPTSKYPEDVALRNAGAQFLRDACDIDRIERDLVVKVKFGMNLFGWEWLPRPNMRMRHNRYVKTRYSYVAIDRGIPALQGNSHMYMTDIIPLSKGIEEVNRSSGCNFSPV